MPAPAAASSWVGRDPDRFTIEERKALAGQWMAIEIYTPATLPLRRVQAIGASPAECIAQLAARGLDPRNFEFTLIDPPY